MTKYSLCKTVILGIDFSIPPSHSACVIYGLFERKLQIKNTSSVMSARFPGLISITNQYCTRTDGGTQARGGGGTLIFSHIRRLGPFFGFVILNFNIFWVFQKNEYFWGMMILWIFLGGHHKIGLV